MRASYVGVMAVLLACVSLLAQVQDNPKRIQALTITVEPSELTLEVGETSTLTSTVRDGSGEIVEGATVVYFSRARRSVGVTRTGKVEAYRSGSFNIVALVPADPSSTRSRPDDIVRVEVPVTVPLPPIERVTFTEVPLKFYVGTWPRLAAELVDTFGDTRYDVPVEFASSDQAVADVDRLGYLTLYQPGTVELSVRAEEIESRLTIEVEASPIVTLELQGGAATARTGDVLRFTAIAKDDQGEVVQEVPVKFSVSGETVPTIIAAGATAQVTADGSFVAERSGTYTVLASIGKISTRHTVEVIRRDVRQEVEVVGRGQVLDRRTSDLWIWEGADGRDYAITGTHTAAGHAYFWDVTDPTTIVKLTDVQVDARTVNDVKVSKDGEIAVISREGASDRKNGIVLLGVGNPREGVPVLSEFTDQLTGGVHNIFISESHVFALSAGRRYDVLNIEDPRNPKRVGRFELETPGHGVHDVWVSDGIAFSSNWGDGVVAVDVGGGGQGGTPERPVELGRYAYPSGLNHAAFPYKSQSTEKFYLFAGDEYFPYDTLNTDRNKEPRRAAGWIHIIDWSEWENPKEVARYQVPEAGSHNIWVEDDVMYVAFYNGGLRVVDVSGELLGDLYKQGREIARFVPLDNDGNVANAPWVWGAQPHKGHIFFTDTHTGLWAVRLLPKTGPGRVFAEPH